MGMMTGNTSAPSFWSKPEGKFGILVSIALAGAFGFGLYKILPILVQMATNLIILGVEIMVIVGAFYALVLDSKLRNLLANFYKRIIRAAYILSFNVDPIGGLKTRMSERKESLVYARTQAGKMKGQSESVQQTINENGQFIEDGLTRMALAKREGDPARATADSIRVGVAQASNKELTALKARIDRSYAMVADIIRKAELGLYVLEGVILVKEKSFNAAKAGRSALKTALGVLRGDTEKDEIFDANIEWIDDYTSSALGEMDAALDLSRDALDSISLQQGVYSQDAFDLLEERLQVSQQKLLDDPRAQKLLEASSDPSVFAGMSASSSDKESLVPVRAKSANFQHLFDRDKK